MTKFDVETEKRGILQGQGTVLRVRGRLDSLINRRFGSANDPVQSLFEVGVRIGSDGKLDFDADRLTRALDANLQGVIDFFLTEETGFADRAEATFDSLTDPITGTFAIEQTAIQETVKSLSERIEQLQEILEVRRGRLLQEFVNMERILSTLFSQQQALFSIAPLSVNPIGKGIF